MATNTRKSSSDTRAGEQPSYQYDPWDRDTGKYSNGLNNDGDYRDASDNQQEDRYHSQAGDRESATQSLRDAENNALSPREPSFADGHDNDSLYTGSGRNKDQKAKGKGVLKGKSALITILMILTGGGVFLSSSHSLLAPALSTLLTNKTQSNYSVYTLRSRFITSSMLRGSSGGAVTTGFTGKTKYTKIPNRLKTRLAKYNIEVEGTGSSTRLSWTHTTSTGGTETISGIDANEFLNMYNDNVEFREAYSNARYGRAATFYDKVADKIYQKLGISRNLQKNYTQTGNAEVDADNYDKTLRPKFEGDSANLKSESNYEWEEYVGDDPDTGEPIYEQRDKSYDPSGDSKTNSATEADARASASGMIADIAGTVGKVGTAVCTALKVGSMIGTAAAAMELYQSINYFMAQMESVSKMKAGYGDASGINTFLNYMTTSETTEVQDYSPTLFDFTNMLDSDVTPSEQSAAMTTEKGAPVEASGLQNLLADAPVNASSTQNYSLERIIKSLGGAAMFGAGTAKTCAGVTLINSIVSLAVTLSPAGIVAITGNFLTGIIKQVAVSVALGAFFSFLVPTLANIFFRNVMDTAVGIPGGQFLARGASASNMGSARRGSAQAPSGKEAIIAANHVNNQVLAMEAEQDRYRLSPFDTSSPNTFFGSIAYSLLPTITSSKITGLSSFIRSTGSSLASLLSSVSAEGEGSTYMTTFGECPLLDEIGVEGDIYCNAIVVSDMDSSMINLEPDDANYNSVLTDPDANDSGIANLTCGDDGECKINNGSDLAKYLNYCVNRDSQVGTVDQNILNELGFSTGTFLDTVVGATPLGDLIDGINSIGQVFGDSIEWANGAKCSNTEENSDFWNREAKYYQVYINDQRILDQMGAYEDSTNPVLAYEEEYEAAHPVDNSYLGYLSRISGLTLENTETVVAFVAYYTYIDSYDPTLRVAVEDMMIKLDGEEVVAEAKDDVINFEDSEHINNPLMTNSTAKQYIVYADIRNRSYAV